MTDAAKKEKIVILGGGVGALTTAFALSRSGWQDRFASITVYQMGWRLGGKGASGRGKYNRIEEHGFHLWLGFYENAFRMMQECYAELGRPDGAPLAHWGDAFKKASVVGAAEHYAGEWKNWIITFSEDEHRVPGVPDDTDEVWTVWLYVKRVLQVMGDLARSLHPSAPHRSNADASPHSLWDTVRCEVADLVSSVEERLQGAEHLALVAALELAESLDNAVAGHTPAHHGLLLRLVEAGTDAVRRDLAQRVHKEDETRRLWCLLELCRVNLRGIIADGLLTRADGLAAINRYDYCEWLKKHGASDEVLDCALLRFLYDLAFAHSQGDPSQRALAADIALQVIARVFFTYKGAIFWKMQAGMGDVVFAPLYLVLKQRGVRFRFFHRVQKLGLSADHRSVATVEIARQVNLVDETKEYQPLFDVSFGDKGLLPCWPAEPLYEQIHNGEQLRGQNLESFWTQWHDVGALTLHAGIDFDRLVFGIALGSVPYLCQELIADNPRWQAMVTQVESVQTQALQVWLAESTAELGWSAPDVNLASYEPPCEGWADMPQLIAAEHWPPEQTPRAIAYFCSVMPTPEHPLDPADTAFPLQEADKVKATALRFLRQYVGNLWPGAMRADGHDFRWELLIGAGTSEGEARLASQYWRANIDPSERYVLAVPGSDQYRLKAHDTGYDNLYLAGDWIDCGFNVGCVEAAVMGGLQAASAIADYPQLTAIIGSHHP